MRARSPQLRLGGVHWKILPTYTSVMSPLFTVGVALLLTILETMGTACLIQWAHSQESANGALALGIALFSGIGCLLGISARFLGRLSIVNAMWQSTSITSVTLLCVFVHGETLTQVQAMGVALAVLSSICLLEDSNPQYLQPEQQPLFP